MPSSVPNQDGDQNQSTNGTGPNLSGVNNNTVINTDGTPSSSSTNTSGASTDPITSIKTDIYGETSDMVNNPSLPVGAVVNPVLQHDSLDEFLNNITPVAAQQGTAGTATAGTVSADLNTTAQQTNTDQISQEQQQAQQGATYTADANAVANTQQGTAAQGTVSDLATVRGQLGLLMGDLSSGNAPWATTAMATAEDTLASRGMGASSIAGSAITQSIMDAGIKIGTQDAQTYAQMDLTNLNNEQQMAIQNTQNRQQSMLSDQAATNAAAQFNAQNSTQVATFFANLMSAADQFNVNQANSMTQSTNTLKSQQAVSQAQFDTQASVANAQNATAISQFNAQQANDMQKFYDGNQLIVDQSNAQLRRDTNTANTAAENTANQLNAANTLEISNTAMNNIWQATRDNASWVFQASQNEQDRAANLAIAAFNRDTSFDLLNQTTQNDVLGSLGQFAFDLFKGKVTS